MNGYIISFVAVLFSIVWTVQKISAVSVKSLVTGTIGEGLKANNHASRQKIVFAFIFLVLAFALILFAILAKTSLSAIMFFCSGILLLLSTLTFFSIWLSRKRLVSLDRNTVIRIGIRNSARNPERSLICATLIGCACFIIVAVGANRHSETQHVSYLQKAVLQDRPHHVPCVRLLQMPPESAEAQNGLQQY